MKLKNIRNLIHSNKKIFPEEIFKFLLYFDYKNNHIQIEDTRKNPTSKYTSIKFHRLYLNEFKLHVSMIIDYVSDIQKNIIYSFHTFHNTKYNYFHKIEFAKYEILNDNSLYLVDSDSTVSTKEDSRIFFNLSYTNYLSLACYQHETI